MSPLFLREAGTRPFLRAHATPSLVHNDAPYVPLDTSSLWSTISRRALWGGATPQSHRVPCTNTDIGIAECLYLTNSGGHRRPPFPIPFFNTFHHFQACPTFLLMRNNVGTALTKNRATYPHVSLRGVGHKQHQTRTLPSPFEPEPRQALCTGELQYTNDHRYHITEPQVNSLTLKDCCPLCGTTRSGCCCCRISLTHRRGIRGHRKCSSSSE